MSLIVSRLDQWRSFYLSSSTKGDISRLQSEASPNPFRISDVPGLTLPVNEATASIAEVFVLSSSLDLVFSSRFPVSESFGNRYVLVPSKDLQPKVATGVYFVLARVDASEYRWKVAIVQ